jgi:GLPGLI family protein
MKCILSVIILLWFVTTTKAQKQSSEKTVLITYEMQLLRNEIMLIRQETQLFYENSKSIFTAFNSNASDISVTNTKDPSFTFPANMLKELFHDTLGDYYIKDFKNKTLMLREFSYNQAYISNEPNLPKMNWQIFSDSTKLVGTYSCIMAKQTFRGRNYIAWFAPNIPLSDGPWKLHGLPGIILDVYDSTGQVRFVATSINIPATFKLNLNPSAKGKKVNWDTFKKADNIEAKILERRIIASNSGRGNVSTASVVKYKLIELNYD